MPKTYVDNAENRRLGRVGMPIGSMPVSRGNRNNATVRGSPGNMPSGHGQVSVSTQASSTYVDNAENRRLGRVGMPVGSMPVSRGNSNNTTVRGSPGHMASGRGQASVSTQSSRRTYVDNAENRRLGRVGMPIGSMPVSGGNGSSASGRDFPGNFPTGRGRSSQSAESPRTYVDNAENRRHGRVGMPIGSMPISNGQTSISTQSLRLYVDNAENRRIGRVGMPVGSMPVGNRRGYDSFNSASPINSSTRHDQTSGSAQNSRTYVDNAQNRKLCRVGMPLGSMPASRFKENEDREHLASLGGTAGIDQSLVDVNDIRSRNNNGARKKVYVDNPQNRKLGRVGMPHGEAVVYKIIDNDNQLALPSQPRVYKDNPQNRLLGRVGLPVGTAVFSSKTKSIVQEKYDDNQENRKLGRVGLPRGCLPLQNRSSKTKKIPEMIQKLEDDYEFGDYIFENRTTCDGDLEIGLRDSQGQLDSAFDQALYLLNRQRAEMSWQRSNATKEPPKTQVAILKDYTGKRIPFDEIKLQKVIGKGAFGMVYFAKWNETVVAVKKLQNEKISDARIRDFGEETLKFCTLDHPNIVKFIGACVEKSNLCIVMEYMQMTLYDGIYIRNDTYFNEKEQLDIIQQVCNGMEYLHKKRIVHCDLKPSNVLLDYVQDNICNVKITDFGLSMIIHDISISVEELVENIGTPQYSPPEMLRGEALSAKDMIKADVYSLALIFMEVIFRQEPFPDYGHKQLKEDVGEGGTKPEYPKFPVIHPNIEEIMQRAWSYEPKHRPSVTEICEIIQELHAIFVY